MNRMASTLIDDDIIGIADDRKAISLYHQR